MKHEFSALIESDSFWSRVKKYGTHFACTCISFGVLHQGVPRTASSCISRNDQIIDM